MEDEDPMKNAAFVVTLALCLASTLAEAVNITVCSEGCDYSSLKAAVFAAGEGDVVIVESGRYYDHLNANKKIFLLGVDTGDGPPILDATGSGSPLTIASDGVVVEGLRLINGGPASAGILVLSSDNVIRKNDASNNYVGIRLVGSNNTTLRGNVASGNLEFGLMLEGSSGCLVSENVLLKNFLGEAFDDGRNSWDDGAIGNRYGDFDDPEEGCSDDDGDGICDAGREIPGGPSFDRHPIAGV